MQSPMMRRGSAWPLKDLIDSQDSEGSIGLLRVLWISKKEGAKGNVEIQKNPGNLR